jgi:hypothetical protein
MVPQVYVKSDTTIFTRSIGQSTSLPTLFNMNTSLLKELNNVRIFSFIIILFVDVPIMLGGKGKDTYEEMSVIIWGVHKTLLEFAV